MCVCVSLQGDLTPLPPDPSADGVSRRHFRVRPAGCIQPGACFCEARAQTALRATDVEIKAGLNISERDLSFMTESKSYCWKERGITNASPLVGFFSSRLGCAAPCQLVSRNALFFLSFFIYIFNFTTKNIITVLSLSFCGFCVVV